MKRLLSRSFIILAVSVSIASCSPPVGTISSKSGLDDMWAVPKRVAYEILDPFTREHFTVLGMFRGAVESIPVKKVTIEIIEDPDFHADEANPFPLSEPFYTWESYGRKLIVIKYRGREAYYSVEVVNNGVPLPGDPEEGSGIITIWRGDPDPNAKPDPDPNPDP
jgi:hypothetical protein